ncbi:iron-containing alcohol dehydrogenase [Hathewaya histolytica]|uniref:iron-containing alcohol dehydrogenase n=1 Tax=Hathewaya histolytica TaxID=1498 RepID=UPI003B678F7E
MWEKNMPIDQISEIRCKSTVFLGVGAIKKINDILKELKSKNVNKILVVTGTSSYKRTGAWDHVENALKDNNMEFELYNKVTSNPTTTHVDEATKVALELGAEAIVAIGGGSVIDAAKSVAIMIKYPNNNCSDLYEYKFTPEEAIPVIAINSTHGTGTEADRFAVVSVLEKKYKPCIAYDLSYPLYSIDDPQLMIGLPRNQTIFTSVDAINHVIEACTTTVASPYSILLAKETVRLVAKYLPIALEDGTNLTARYYLAYASLIAGIAFDNGLLHLTHALEHPLSAVKPDLAHGLGLAMLVPSVVKYTYEARPEVLADVLSPIIPELTGDKSEAQIACDGLRAWLRKIGVTETLKTEGFREDQIDELTHLAFNTPSLDLLLSCSPAKATEELVSNIYRESL